MISGADGFLGNALCRKFCRDYQVFALVRNTKTLKRIGDLVNQLELVDVNTVDFSRFFSEHNIKATIHAATNYGHDGSDIVSVVDTNVMLPLKLLQSSSVVKDSIFVNTDTFLSKRPVDHLYGHLESYALSKKQIVEWFQSWNGPTKVVTLRLEHMYGPSDSNVKFARSIIQRLMQNEPSIALTDGMQRRDFVYIDDVVSAYALLLQNISKQKPGHTVMEVGTGVSTSVREFVETAKALTGSNSELRFGAIDRRKNEFPESVANTDLLSELGFAPKITLAEGIQQIIKSLN